MAINKVQYGNSVLIDLTDTTAEASDVLLGKYFYGKDGVKTLGTGTGGGGSVTQDQDGFIVLPPDGGGSPSVGGLEYETGTWTPSENIARPTISFTNSHTTPPIHISFVDATNDYGTSGVTNTNMGFEYTDWWRLTKAGLYYASSTIYYGVVNYWYRTTSAEAFTANRAYFTVNSDNATDSNTTYPRYWANETGFKPYTSSTTRYWRSGRTYKWIAVWAPTT